MKQKATPRPRPAALVNIYRHNGKGRCADESLYLLPDPSAVTPAGIRFSGSNAELELSYRKNRRHLKGIHIVVCIPAETLADLVRAAANYALDKVGDRCDTKETR